MFDNNSLSISDDLLVSVRMLTYNHEKYVAKAIESVLMQEVSFRYELVIGDDASTDKTASIITEYANKYPEIIKPVLRQVNVGNAENSYHIRKVCSGKYMAALEGDDYWTDKHKLQKQVNFLEKHTNCFSVAHRHAIVNENEDLLGYSHKFLSEDRYFSKQDALKYGTDLLHPNTVMHYNFFREDEELNTFFRNANRYGIHSLLIYYLAVHSDIYVFKDIMSVWRKVEDSNADNYTSFAIRNTLDVAMNDVVKYTKYRSYFGKVYNFNGLIRKKMIILFFRLFISNTSIRYKWDLFWETLRFLRVSDILYLPLTFITMALNKVRI